MKKLVRQNGETLVEVLWALLIITMVFVMLTGTITSTARINDKAQKTDISFTYDEEAMPSEGVVTFTWTETDTIGISKKVEKNENVNLYKTSDEVERYYYTIKGEDAE